ncbi:hypothetical protein M6D93_15880 [Jatrophihabitans telluris]|uniref:DUF559 domain-containing protein n=1 Tax=Jatrophihabitans telluris TaxID=2038343 RepID=A0ABY4QY48_9ACTN|nr:hypothetical protein [Jatrophihabitans telluris]UQX87766.1 hypothetical protein M6D93_15880 [Jatrophihabitans telluris]
MINHDDPTAKILSAGVTTRSRLLAAGCPPAEVRSMPRPGGIRASRSLVGEPDCADAFVRIAAGCAVSGPRAVVIGWSAALLHGVPTTFVDGRWEEDELLPVAINPRTKCRQREGILRSYSQLLDSDVVQIGGLSVSTGTRTLFDVLRLSRGRVQALQLADACVRFGVSSPDELTSYASKRKRWPGIRRVRALAPLLTAFAESPMESAFRLHWLDAGLRQPLVNPSIFDSFGNFVARVDLLDPVSGLVGEYDGEWHERGDRPRADLRRIGKLERLGFTTVRVTRDLMRGGGVEAARLLVERRWRTEASARRPRSGTSVISQDGRRFLW